MAAEKAGQDDQDIFQGNRTRQDGRSAPGDLDSKTFITWVTKCACVVKVFFVFIERRNYDYFYGYYYVCFVPETHRLRL